MKTIISDVSNQEADVLLTGTLKGWRVQPTWTFVDCKLLEIFSCIRMTLHHLKHHVLDGGDDGQAHQDYKSWNWDAGEASCGEMTRSPASYCRSTCWIPPSPTTICQNTTFFFLEKIHPCANYYSFIFIHIKVILCGHFLLYKTSCIVVVCKLIKKKQKTAGGWLCSLWEHPENSLFSPFMVRKTVCIPSVTRKKQSRVILKWNGRQMQLKRLLSATRPAAPAAFLTASAPQTHLLD